MNREHQPHMNDGTIETSPLKRRDFFKIFALGGMGLGLSNCENGQFQPGPAMDIINVIPGVPGVHLPPDVREAIAIASIAFTIISYYQTTQRQREYAMARQAAAKKKGAKYNKRYVAVKVPREKTQDRNYSKVGKSLEENNKKVTTVDVVVLDTQNSQLVGSNTYEVSNGKEGEPLRVAGKDAVYAGAM